jgi:TrmH family RNA methyltransferase
MITSLSNPKVKLVQGLQSRRRTRYRKERMVAEGTRLVQEALTAGLMPDLVLYTADWGDAPAGAALLASLIEPAIPALPVSPEVMAGCSDTETPQGVLAVLPFPQHRIPSEPSLVLVVDQMRVPGNLGTILRTAAAAGVELVLLPPGTVDPFNPKAVRGGMGAHFRLPILQLDWDGLEKHLIGLDVWLAAAGGGTRYDQVDWTRPVALIVGGEASGAGDRAVRLATGDAGPGRIGGRVHIPMPGGMESLNAAVAAGVLLFEVVRQRS